MDDVLAHLAGLDEHHLETALIACRTLWAKSDNHAVLAKLLTAIDKSTYLSPTEKRDRLIRLLGMLAPSVDSVLAAHHSIEDGSPYLKSAVASYVPPDFRQRLGRTAEPFQSTIRVDSGIVPEAEAVRETTSWRYEGALVLLIGSSSVFETSKSLLRGSELPHQVVSDLSEALAVDYSQLCGIVVDVTGYAGIPASERLKTLRNVLLRSSFSWVKLDVSGLDGHQEDIVAIKSALRPSSVGVDDNVLSNSSALSGVDLGFILPRARSLLAFRQNRLMIDGLSESEELLVEQAIRQELSLHNVADDLRLPLRVRVASGRSGSKTLVVRTQALQYPIIVRLNSVETLLGSDGELERIKKLILPWDPMLAPSAYTLGDHCALIYATVRDLVDSNRTAFMLSERLSELQKAELPDSPGGIPNTSALRHAVEEVLDKLSNLNKFRPPEGTVSYGYDFVLEHLTGLAGGRASPSYLFNGELHLVASVLERALELTRHASAIATNHGDPHVSNVLLPRDSHAELIDFERASPGHPLYDICHLTISLLGSSFRAYSNFDETVQILRTCLCEGNEVQETGSGVNDLILYACAKARARSRELIDHYHLQESEFHAMLVIVACMGISYLPQLHSEVCKAIIAAAAPFLKDD